MYIKTIKQLEQDDRDKLVIDIRKKEDFDKETYPNAINIYFEDFKEKDHMLPKDKPIYLLCYSGERSDELASEYADKGYEIYSIEQGYRAYLRLKLEGLLNNEEKKEDRCADIERSIIKKFRKEIWRKFTAAINEYKLIEDGDKIAVCISGGKDSMLMAKLFQELKRHGKQNFEVVFLVMNPGYNDINYQTILDNAKLLNVPITVFKSEIFDIVADVGDSPCYLCARMRRGHLYSKAKELGCNKIALGHHFSDVVETILMGMLYGGQVQTMMPKLKSTNFEGMELIRPLYLIHEEDIIRWVNYNELHFIQCACRFTESCASCGGTEKGSKRAEIKELIKELTKKSPFIEKNIFRSVENVCLDTVIAYKQKGVKHHFLDEYYIEKTNIAVPEKAAVVKANEEPLVKNVIDQIKEAQIKLGYVKESMRFYYPLTSINAMLETSFESIEEFLNKIKTGKIFKSTVIGELLFNRHQDRIEVSVSAEGVEYVHKNIPAPPFLEELINLFMYKHNASIEEICQLFEKYSDKYVCEKMPEGEDFDYVIYFLDKNIDEYYYCIKNEMEHTIYHRFIKEDYEQLLQ